MKRVTNVEKMEMNTNDEYSYGYYVKYGIEIATNSKGTKWSSDSWSISWKLFGRLLRWLVKWKFHTSHSTKRFLHEA